MAAEPYSWRGDPAVPAFPDQRPLIVFDGECVLCSATAKFVLKHDGERRFRLTTAQSSLGEALYRHFGLSHGLDGTMLLIADGRLFVESDAALGIARRLGQPFALAAVGRLVPRTVRDRLYKLVARNRFRLFGRRETCWVPSPATADRIL